jgi:hypothetical protein
VPGFDEPATSDFSVFLLGAARTWTYNCHSLSIVEPASGDEKSGPACPPAARVTMRQSEGRPGGRPHRNQPGRMDALVLGISLPGAADPTGDSSPRAGRFTDIGQTERPGDRVLTLAARVGRLGHNGVSPMGLRAGRSLPALVAGSATEAGSLRKQDSSPPLRDVGASAPLPILNRSGDGPVPSRLSPGLVLHPNPRRSEHAGSRFRRPRPERPALAYLRGCLTRIVGVRPWVPLHAYTVDVASQHGPFPHRQCPGGRRAAR